MRTVKYVGLTKNIGRFGTVKVGDTLNLTEGEWAYVKNNDEFMLIGGDVTPISTESGAGILPLGNPLYDLREIAWESPTIFDRLNARFSRQKLCTIIDAIRLIGGTVKKVDLTGQKIWLVDAIISASINMCWDHLDEVMRWKLPYVSINNRGNAIIPKEELDEIREELVARAYRNQTKFPRRAKTLEDFKVTFDSSLEEKVAKLRKEKKEEERARVIPTTPKETVEVEDDLAEAEKGVEEAFEKPTTKPTTKKTTAKKATRKRTKKED